MTFEKATILGVGLIGASMALAMKKNSLCARVTGYGRTEGNLLRARELRIIDSYELDPAKACEGADLVVFSTPPARFASLAGEVRESLKEGAIVIDVGSVKGKLVHEMEGLMPPGARFVGCHPIAGSERSGIDAASGDLFKGAKCIITRTGGTDGDAFQEVSALWEGLGSDVTVMSPEEHDRVYALVSHVPHLLAYALMNTVAEIDGSYVEFAGQGFKDTTRIASSSPDIWRDICLMNRDNLLELIERFKDNMDRLSLHLRAGDAEALEEAFRRARALRETIENRA
jgi:prephenate dehydrogenase